MEEWTHFQWPFYSLLTHMYGSGAGGRRRGGISSCPLPWLLSQFHGFELPLSEKQPQVDGTAGVWVLHPKLLPGCMGELIAPAQTSSRQQQALLPFLWVLSIAGWGEQGRAFAFRWTVAAEDLSTEKGGWWNGARSAKICLQQTHLKIGSKQ